MPSRSFQREVFTSADRISNIKKINSKRYINGHLVAVNSKSFKIQNAAQILRKNDVLPVVEPTDGDDIFMPTADANTSLAVLAAIGVTPLKNQERDNSFLKTQKMEPLANPNIIETDRLKALKNEKIKADKNFKNPTNAFYNLDESMSINKSRQITKLDKAKNQIDSSNLVVGIFESNILNSTTKPLRQFK